MWVSHPNSGVAGPAALAPSRMHSVDRAMTSGHDRYHATALVASQEDGPAHGRTGEFDAFFREQYEALLHFLRRRSRTREDAEDVAQESLARFIRYTETQPPEAWKPTLYRIAINVVNDRQRKFRPPRARRDPLGRVDFSWEREWRYPHALGAFAFGLEDVFCGLCPHGRIEYFQQQFDGLKFIDPTRPTKWYAKSLLSAEIGWSCLTLSSEGGAARVLVQLLVDYIGCDATW